MTDYSDERMSCFAQYRSMTALKEMEFTGMRMVEYIPAAFTMISSLAKEC